MPLIEVRNIGKTYSDGTVAISDVTFAIDEGEFVSITGPSGSGKSTLLHILGFLDRQSSGTYLFKAKGMDAHGPDALAHIRNRDMGFVFQAFNLLPRTSVLDNVCLPLYYSSMNEKEWIKRARDVLDMVGLSHREDHLSHELSGGEKQRVAIARALVLSPKVLFADEPTGNLDTRSGESILSLLSTLHESGHTVILITHDHHIAKSAKRSIVIEDGKVVRDIKL
jgi:putative ABC transport system ATP-binding protein